MNIHLLRIYSVPIRISSPEFHVQGTCSFHEWDSVRWHVVATCHPRIPFMLLYTSRGT